MTLSTDMFKLIYDKAISFAILRKHRNYSKFIAQSNRKDVVRLIEIAAKEANADQRRVAHEALK